MTARQAHEPTFRRLLRLILLLGGAGGCSIFAWWWLQFADGLWQARERQFEYLAWIDARVAVPVAALLLAISELIVQGVRSAALPGKSTRLEGYVIRIALAALIPVAVAALLGALYVFERSLEPAGQRAPLAATVVFAVFGGMIGYLFGMFTLVSHGLVLVFGLSGVLLGALMDLTRWRPVSGGGRSADRAPPFA